MAITNPSGIPAQFLDDLRETLQAVGPRVAPDVYPVDGNGNPETALNNQQAAQLFEVITRRFWRDQIRSHKAQQAAEQARETAIGAVGDDPFAATG